MIQSILAQVTAGTTVCKQTCSLTDEPAKAEHLQIPLGGLSRGEGHRL